MKRRDKKAESRTGERSRGSRFLLLFVEVKKHGKITRNT